MRFFIVDDEDYVHDALQKIIEKEELWELVGTANNGTEVEGEFLQKKQVDVVFIDLIMPKMTGLETVNKLVHSSYKGRLIMISQIYSQDLIGKAYSLGVDYYIQKPISQFELVPILRNRKLIT